MYGLGIVISVFVVIICAYLSGFFRSFPFWFPLLFFYPFLSPLLLTNQALGEHGAFLQMLFNNQQEHLQQLQLQNQQLQNQFSSLQNNLPSAASGAAVAVTQSLPIPTPSSTSTHPVKGADPEKFSGDCGETDGFIRAVKLSIAVQPSSFQDEQTKMLYALSFMMRGTAEV